MVKIIKCLVFVTSVILSADVFATDVNITSSRIGVVNDTYALLIPDVTITEPKPGCATLNMLSWDKTTEHGKMMFSLALAAHVSGKVMLVGYDSNVCELDNRLKLTKIHMYK